MNAINVHQSAAASWKGAFLAQAAGDQAVQHATHRLDDSVQNHAAVTTALNKQQ